MARSENTKTQVLEILKKIPIVQAACEKVGVSRATYYRWKEDPAFSKMADEAIDEGYQVVNDIAESQLISAVKDKNMPAITYWLRHHHKNYFDKAGVSARVETSAAEVFAALTPKERMALLKADNPVRKRVKIDPTDR